MCHIMFKHLDVKGFLCFESHVATSLTWIDTPASTPCQQADGSPFDKYLAGRGLPLYYRCVAYHGAEVQIRRHKNGHGGLLSGNPDA